MKQRNLLAGLGKLLQRKTDGLVMNQKTIVLRQQLLSLKGFKISRRTISRKLNEINLNSRVASTKPYISKKNKMSRLKLPLNTSYGLKNRGIVFISEMS